MIEAVANSRYAADTPFIVIEDDVQDSPITSTRTAAPRSWSGRT
jgi:hypothetical protein